MYVNLSGQAYLSAIQAVLAELKAKFAGKKFTHGEVQAAFMAKVKGHNYTLTTFRNKFAMITGDTFVAETMIDGNAVEKVQKTA